ncbi:integrin alpha, partial [bacterium]|nr:integrin alpha [bacterium]
MSDLNAVRLYHPGAYSYQIGSCVAGIGDIDGDGFREIAIGAPTFDPGGDLGLETRNGAVFIMSGKMLQYDNTKVDLSESGLIAWSIIGRQESQIGGVIAALSDINGDGFDDFAFTSPEKADTYIMFGGEVIPRVLPLNDFGHYGIRIKNSGASVCYAGDFNGDGFYDAALGQPFDVDSPQGSSGRISLLYGAASFEKVLDATELPSIAGLPDTK